MPLRPYKYQVAVTLQSVDDDGNVTGETLASGLLDESGQQHEFVFFTADQLVAWVKDFPAELARRQTAAEDPERPTKQGRRVAQKAAAKAPAKKAASKSTAAKG